MNSLPTSHTRTILSAILNGCTNEAHDFHAKVPQCIKKQNIYLFICNIGLANLV